MLDPDPTRIGSVRRVLGSQITVALDSDLAGVSPIYRGSLQPIGQIGSLVRIPQGLVDLVATVSLLGISELAGPQAPTEVLHSGERWLEVQLLGEVRRATRKFERGVGSYPGLDDPVHFATADDLLTVFPARDDAHVQIGCLTAATEVPVCLNASRLVVRHGAIVGSTGSGKTSAVASILQSFVRDGWTNSNIIVIDPHGEYGRALGGDASVRSVIGSGSSGLNVPYWALPAGDVLRVFAGTGGGPTTSKRFAELVRDGRRAFTESASWLQLDAEAITADTPVPFDLRSVWFQLDAENRETRDKKSDPATARIVRQGSAQNLDARTFVPNGAGSTLPDQGPLYGVHNNVPELLRLGLLDPRLSFFVPDSLDVDNDPLISAMSEWLGDEKPVSVLSFSGVPEEAAELAIGVVLKLLFEVAIRTTTEGPGIGRSEPVLIVLEEAHRYLGESAAVMARTAANRIAREGRKYGVGLLLVTQRPSELPDTALAQCGTLIALRLSNAQDQSKIKAALPDSVAGLAAALPSLRTGEAVISGEALVLPARTLITCPDPLPHAEDPSLSSWRQAPMLPDLKTALAAWRGTYET